MYISNLHQNMNIYCHFQERLKKFQEWSDYSDCASPWRESKAAKEPTDGWYGRPTTSGNFQESNSQDIEEHIIDTLDVCKKVCVYISE